MTDFIMGLIICGCGIIGILIGLFLVSLLAREKAPMIYPQAGIGGNVVKPIEGVKVARFLEEGRRGAIQVELEENAPRFHVFLYQVWTKKGKTHCRYRRRLLIDPKKDDIRSFAKVNDKKANAFAIANDPVKGHLHVSLTGLFLSPIIMGVVFFFSVYYITFGFSMAAISYLRDHGITYTYDFYMPSSQALAITLGASVLVGLFTLLIIYATSHEGRRARR